MIGVTPENLERAHMASPVKDLLASPVKVLMLANQVRAVDIGLRFQRVIGVTLLVAGKECNV